MKLPVNNYIGEQKQSGAEKKLRSDAASENVRKGIKKISEENLDFPEQMSCFDGSEDRSDKKQTKEDSETSGLTLEKARELLGDEEISDEKLQEIANSIKIFCSLSYELYRENRNGY